MRRRIVALGGGGFSDNPEDLLIHKFLLSLAGSDAPRVCYVPTAGGDRDEYVARFYRAYSSLNCHPTDLRLFDRTVGNLDRFILAQDIIYVGGGNTASLLAVWRAHGLAEILARAWARGIVLSGISAGMNCWFEASVTDSFGGGQLAPLPDGLGLLPGSCCPHYDGEAQRRPTFTRLIEAGELPAGWAADDGAALVFAGTRLKEVVSWRSQAAAYRVEKGPDGVSERRVAARYLGEAT